MLTLSGLLARAYDERVIILIDEYDTPIHAGLTHGFYEQAVQFCRNLVSYGLKDNVHLHRGVLSGILRLAQESVFSGLNNPDVFTVTSRRLQTAFRFTVKEVTDLAYACGQRGHLDDLDRWYNGYRFGDEIVFNPWSVLNYLDHPEEGLRPYWVAASDNALLEDPLIRRGARLSADLEAVLRGEVLLKTVDDEVVLREIGEQPDAVWGLLVHLVDAHDGDSARRHLFGLKRKLLTKAPADSTSVVPEHQSRGLPVLLDADRPSPASVPEPSARSMSSRCSRSCRVSEPVAGLGDSGRATRSSGRPRLPSRGRR